MIYTYTDAYLKSRVNDAIEARAIEDVDAIRAFPESPVNWRSRLTVLRAYIILCLEQTSASDDVYAAKLSHYNKEFGTVLAQANAAADALTTNGYRGAYSVPLERG